MHMFLIGLFLSTIGIDYYITPPNHDLLFRVQDELYIAQLGGHKGHISRYLNDPRRNIHVTIVLSNTDNKYNYNDNRVNYKKYEDCELDDKYNMVIVDMQSYNIDFLKISDNRPNILQMENNYVIDEYDNLLTSEEMGYVKVKQYKSHSLYIHRRYIDRWVEQTTLTMKKKITF